MQTTCPGGNRTKSGDFQALWLLFICLFHYFLSPESFFLKINYKHTSFSIDSHTSWLFPSFRSVAWVSVVTQRHV